MRLVLVLLSLTALLSDCLAADRPVLLITPKGAYQSTVTDGVPGPWGPVTIEVDILIQGFGTPPTPRDEPDPPDTDPVVLRVASISKTVLKNADEALQAAVLVETLQKQQFTEAAKFGETLVLIAGMADPQLKTEGRIVRWAEQVTAVTEDPVKLLAGTRSAFSLSSAEVQEATEGRQPEGRALDIAKLMVIIEMILTILRATGILK